MRFPISITHNFLLEPIMHTFGAKPEVCYAELHDKDLEVRFGIWFHEHVPLASLGSAAPSEWPWWGGLGVMLAHHGVGVVGSTEGVVNLAFEAPQKMRVIVDVEATQLWVSLEDPQSFLKALAEKTGKPTAEKRPF
jgi:hypothetical protein